MMRPRRSGPSATCLPNDSRRSSLNPSPNTPFCRRLTAMPQQFSTACHSAFWSAGTMSRSTPIARCSICWAYADEDAFHAAGGMAQLFHLAPNGADSGRRANRVRRDYARHARAAGDRLGCTAGDACSPCAATKTATRRAQGSKPESAQRRTARRANSRHPRHRDRRRRRARLRTAASCRSTVRARRCSATTRARSSASRSPFSSPPRARARRSTISTA